MQITSFESIECTQCFIASEYDWRFEVRLTTWQDDKKVAINAEYIALDYQVDVVMGFGGEFKELNLSNYAQYQLDSYLWAQLKQDAIGYYEKKDKSGEIVHEGFEYYSGEVERSIIAEFAKTTELLKPDPNDPFDVTVLQMRIAELEAQIRQLKGLA